ncbi:MAG: phosphotransferase [Euzebyales bacterium]|nr:phosphotransferase [Euzebyales bacterium]
MARHWGGGRTGGHVQRSAARPARGVAADVLTRAVRLVLASMWVGRQRKGSEGAAAGDLGGRFPLLIRTRFSEDAVLLDPKEGLVLRTHRSSPPSPAVLEARRRLARHLAMPSWEVRPEVPGMTEEYVEGDHLAALPQSEQEAVVRELLVAQGRLAADEGEGSTAAVLQGALQVVDRVDAPVSLRAELDRERPRLAVVAERCPLVPAHGDMSSDNLVVRDGRPVIIDLEWAGMLPFGYDPLWLLLEEAVHRRRPALLQAYLRGVFDPELRAACTAADLPPAEGTGRRLLLLVLLVRCHVTTRHQASGDARFALDLAAGWEALSSATAAAQSDD